MRIPWLFRQWWARFWMIFGGHNILGRMACWIASWSMPPYYGRYQLRYMNPKGYISLFSKVWHENLSVGPQVFIGDGVVIFQNQDGGKVLMGRQVGLADGVTIETGDGACIEIGDGSRFQTRCHLGAYKSSIIIGKDVGVGPGCRLYSHNHGASVDSHRSLISKGPIVIEDGVWLGADVKVLSGVRIGRGSVVGTGSVVTHDIPEDVIAVGNPARVIKKRSEMSH